MSRPKSVNKSDVFIKTILLAVTFSFFILTMSGNFNTIAGGFITVILSLYCLGHMDVNILEKGTLDIRTL